MQGSADAYIAGAGLSASVIALAHQRGVAPTQFELQMLRGVCEALRDRLLGLGFRVRIYVPYGEDWYGYGARRMKESPHTASYVLRAMLGF